MLQLEDQMRDYFWYEYSRDANILPCCWKTTNDHCLPHFHSSIEIVYVSQGELTATLNGQVLLVQEKHFIVVPSHTIHHYETTAFSSSIVLVFPVDFIPSYKPIFRMKTFASYIAHNSKLHHEMLHCLNSILKSLEIETPPYHKNITKGYIYVLLGLLIDCTGLITIPNNKMTSLAQEILLYLQDHYLNPITLEDTSKYFGYSKSRFSHIFNEYFGCPLIRYINSLRCQHALELIKEKKNSITDIALASGFESTRTFYRAFHNCFGITPQQAADITVNNAKGNISTTSAIHFKKTNTPFSL